MNIEEQTIGMLVGPGIDSYNVMDKFLEIAPSLNDMEYWYLLADAYNSADNLFHYKKIIKGLFTSSRKHREYLMTEEERKYLSKLPDELKVYRAMTVTEYKSGDFGISWTLSKKVAKFFKDEYVRNYSTMNEPRVIKTMIIDKNQIIAYWNDRKEEEIIIMKK